jgi:hypothetical protein
MVGRDDEGVVIWLSCAKISEAIYFMYFLRSSFSFAALKYRIRCSDTDRAGPTRSSFANSQIFSVCAYGFEKKKI